MIDHPSPNFGPRRNNGPIDILLLHYTEIDDLAGTLDILCDPKAEVSAHYVLDKDGTAYRLVAEDLRAWHAGQAFWAGERDINSRSIGIEIVNAGDLGAEIPAPYPDAQIAGLIALCLGILRRHPIPAHRVLGHSDVAIGRKIDPGRHFPWAKLADAGIGLWPAPSTGDAIDEPTFRAWLGRYGYEGAAPGAIAAFQRHFRPNRVDGRHDRDCGAILAALLAAIG